MDLRQFPGGEPALSLLDAPFYDALTIESLSRVLRLSSSNQEGSTVGASQYHTGSSNHLFAVDNNRFIHFTRDSSSNRPALTVTEVTSGTPTVSSNVEIRAASTSIVKVVQNPVNKLQFAALDASGYTHIVTVDATGTGVTISSHNTVGAITDLVYNKEYSDIVWEPGGTYFLVCTAKTVGNAGIFALFTVSGTTLSFVTNSNTSGTFNAIANVIRSKAALTGGASNETVFTMPKNTGAANIARVTFSASAITIQASASISTSGGDTSLLSSVFVHGTVHIYGLGASPHLTNRLLLDGASSGSAKSLSSKSGNCSCLEPEIGKAPFGNNAFFALAETTSSSDYATHPMFWGVAGNPMGYNSLYTRSITVDPVAFCVSHDYSKALIIVGTTGDTTNTYAGFSVPTT